MTDILNESLVRDPLDGFIDREEILAQFLHLLHSAQTGTFHLLAIKGQSGTGKTFLIEYLSKRICPQAGWQTGVLAFAQSFPDFRTLLDGVEDGLKKCVPRQSLTQYRTLREEYKRRFDEYRANITVTQTTEAKEASSISHTQQNAQVNAELRRREMQLRAELTRALLELAEECEHPLCLFIDGYERLAEMDHELVGWLWEEVLLRLPQHASMPILLMTCGWEHPMSAAIQPFSTNKELDDFDLVRVKSYLQTQGIILSDTPSQEPLVRAFYDLTKGHPFVLALAVTYFQALPEIERTPESLRTKSPLLVEETRVQWLEERLLKRLPEPYLTLLEHGPILRSFDQAALKALLSAELDGKQSKMTLDDRSYERFLRYPFINQKNAQGDTLLEQPTFHDLMRNVGLEALCRLHPETKQQLHHVMAEYYGALPIEARQQFSSTQRANLPNPIYSEWFAAIPEQGFQALLEWLYHTLQIKEVQVEAFDLWLKLIDEAVIKWQRKQAGPLLELVRQVVVEGEPFLEKQSNHYGKYLVWYSRFLKQEAYRDDAYLALQEALQIFKQRGNLLDQAVTLNGIGDIYETQGQLEQALDSFQQALILFKQMGHATGTAASLNGIGSINHSQGELEQALDCYEQALTLFEQVGNLAETAFSFNRIGSIYNSQGELEQALNYFQQALTLYEQVGDPAGTAASLDGIGSIYHSQGKLEQALDYYEQALALCEQVGNPADTAFALNCIGSIYSRQKQLDRALDYFQRVLALCEQVGNPANTATSLNNIGSIYYSQGELEQALDYYEQAIILYEQAGRLAGTATSLNNIGSIYYSQGELEQALDYYEQALALFEQVGNPADTAASLNNIAILYVEQEQWQDALLFFSKAVSLYEQMGHGFEANIADKLEGIAVCYAMQGEFEKGESYHKRAEQIREQLQKSQE